MDKTTLTEINAIASSVFLKGATKLLTPTAGIPPEYARPLFSRKRK